MNKKVPSKREKAGLKPQHRKLSAGDEEALDLFCESFDFDEISFSDWSKSLRSLDIFIDHYILAQAAYDGGQALVNFVRTVKTKNQFEKLPVQKTISWPANSKHQDILIYKKEGDFDHNAKGDLKIRINIRGR